MKRILIVDDEEDTLDFMQRGLSRENYKVVTASTGEEALAICKADHPDLVLLDIAMPQMDGYVTCERIKEDPRLKDTAVVFITAKELTTQGIMSRCQELGACGHIAKPFTMTELLEKIKEILSSDS